MSVKILLYKSKTMKNGEHPIMIRYIKNRKPKYVSIGYSSSEKLWDEENNKPKKKHPHYHGINVKISKKLFEIHKKIAELDNDDRELRHHDFKKVAKKPEGKKSFIHYAQELIEKTKERGKVSTANWYRDGLKALTKMVDKDVDIRFADIDETLLKRLYEQLAAKPVRDTTISNYMRALSSIYGKAVEEGEISKRDFPFNLSKLNIKTQKRAISKDAIAGISSLDIEPGSSLEFARDIFLFSYYCRGLNFVDMAQIKWSDIHDGRLIYRRSKTSSQFNIKLLPPALAILSRYENIRGDLGYVFPVYNTYHDTPQKQFDRRRKVLKTVNSNLGIIGKKIGVHLNLTSYVARHTYASVMMRSGAKTSVIKDSLGHSRIQTTEIYLDSFGSEELDEANEGIL